MMGKGAQENIADLLADAIRHYNKDEWLGSDKLARLVMNIIIGLGYRKLPKDKPPLLSYRKFEAEFQKLEDEYKDEGMPYMWGKQVAQAQREADIKFYSEGK